MAYLQPWNPLVTPNTQVTSASAIHVSRAVSGPAVEVISGVVTQPSTAEVRPTGKKELPEVVMFFSWAYRILNLVSMFSYLWFSLFYRTL